MYTITHKYVQYTLLMTQVFYTCTYLLSNYSILYVRIHVIALSTTIYKNYTAIKL